MIAFISGEIIDVEVASLVVNVQGVGMQVNTTMDVIAAAKIGEIISLYTILIVREDSLNLYGNRVKEE